MQQEALNAFRCRHLQNLVRQKFKLMGGFLLPGICFSNTPSAVKWQT